MVAPKKSYKKGFVSNTQDALTAANAASARANGFQNCTAVDGF
jgi:hypothetical protein